MPAEAASGVAQAIAATTALAPWFDGKPKGALWVAFSGGRDSTVLLHALRDVPGVAATHIDHGLDEDSPTWARQCARVAADFGVGFEARRVCVAASGNREQAARRARYAAWRELLRARRLARPSTPRGRPGRDADLATADRSGTRRHARGTTPGQRLVGSTAARRPQSGDYGLRRASWTALDRGSVEHRLELRPQLHPRADHAARRRALSRCGGTARAAPTRGGAGAALDVCDEHDDDRGLAAGGGTASRACGRGGNPAPSVGLPGSRAAGDGCARNPRLAPWPTTGT